MVSVHGRHGRTALRVAAGLALALALAVVGRAALTTEREFHYPRADVALPATLAGARGAHFSTADGVALEGWFVPPRNGATVVLVHGLGQGRAGLLPEAQVLVGAGYGVLLFDLRGHGRSGGRSSTWGERERLDVLAALAWARAQPEVDAARLGALGFSIGASALAQAAAQDGGLAAVALVSPYSSLDDAVDTDVAHRDPLSRLGGRLPLWVRGVDLGRARPEEAVQRLGDKPLWLVLGTEEPGAWMVERLALAQPAAQTWRVEGAHHGDIPTVAPDEYARRLRAFFDAALGPPPHG